MARFRSVDSSVRRPAPRPVFLPLRRLALCLDCDVCFEIGADACPACGSETWCPLARFLEMGARTTEVRQLVVVSRQRAHLHEQLRRVFAGNATIHVLTDRRRGDRRALRLPHAPDRRLVDRRVRRQMEDDLKANGWAIIRIR